MKLFQILRTSYRTSKQHKKMYLISAAAESILVAATSLLSAFLQTVSADIVTESAFLSETGIQWLLKILPSILCNLIHPLLAALPWIWHIHFKAQTVSYKRLFAQSALYYCILEILFFIFDLIFFGPFAINFETPLMALLSPIYLGLIILFDFLFYCCYYFGFYYLLSGQKVKRAFCSTLSASKSHPFRKLFYLLTIPFVCYFSFSVFLYFIQKLIEQSNIAIIILNALLTGIPYPFMWLCFYSVWKYEWEN